jgi:hypothetical protein
MRRFIAAIGICMELFPLVVVAKDAPISRRDGFLLIWSALHRSVDKVSSSFDDVHAADKGYAEISFAKARGFFSDKDGKDPDTFRPKESLSLEAALLWLFRTRNVEGVFNKPVEIEDLRSVLDRYPIARLPQTGEPNTAAAILLSEADLLSLMRNLDADLKNEVHEISFYSEDFQGQGTAFGETFDMNAMTAAHRSLPYNTLINVTNVANGKSVTVRINDRGPYVEGRDLDLSLAAFTSIAERSSGKIQATIQRLGDVNVVGPCTRMGIYQSRIAKGVRLSPGVPHVLALGSPVNLHGSEPFVVRNVQYPDGNFSDQQDWVLPGENFHFVPSVEGQYVFYVDTKDGRGRTMDMHVVRCSEGQ